MGDCQKMANNFIGGIVSITLGGVMVASVFIATIKGVNTDTWETSEVALWAMLPLAGIIGMVYGTLAVFGLV